MSSEVFVDSGVFIAFLVRKDHLHSVAKKLFSKPPRRWMTSTLVIAETYSWFLHRFGEEAARNFRHLLEDLPGLRILDTDESHRAAVGRKLEALRGCKLTYIDASSLVWIEQRRIATAWATDHHLAIEGARVVPGSPGS